MSQGQGSWPSPSWPAWQVEQERRKQIMLREAGRENPLWPSIPTNLLHSLVQRTSNLMPFTGLPALPHGPQQPPPFTSRDGRRTLSSLQPAAGAPRLAPAAQQSPSTSLSTLPWQSAWLCEVNAWHHSPSSDRTVDYASSSSLVSSPLWAAPSASAPLSDQAVLEALSVSTEDVVDAPSNHTTPTTAPTSLNPSPAITTVDSPKRKRDELHDRRLKVEDAQRREAAPPRFADTEHLERERAERESKEKLEKLEAAEFLLALSPDPPLDEASSPKPNAADAKFRRRKGKSNLDTATACWNVGDRTC